MHCSAGVGRSGTFIALDWLLQELEEGSLDDVPDTADPVVGVVAALRQQRTMMVQGDPQFAFIYDTLRDRWRERWISRFPDEAARLGVAPAVVVSAAEPPPTTTTMRAGGEDGPRLKRQKSARDEASLGVGAGALAAAGSLGNDVVSEGDEDSSDDRSGEDDEEDDEDDDDDDEDDEDDEEELRIYHSQSGEARADLEAALQGAEMEFERGKT